MPEQLPLAALLLVASISSSLAGFWIVRANRPARAAFVSAIAAFTFALPVIFAVAHPHAPAWLKGVVVLLCPLAGIKLIDASLGAECWRGRPLRQWIAFWLNPYVLCHRRHIMEPPHDRATSFKLLARGLLEIAAGSVVLSWAFQQELGRYSFWLDHGVKLFAMYLIVFDGMFVALTGALRLLGCNIMDQSHHPIAAVTPADFWRRYNREAGRFLYEDLFKPAGGLRAPVAGILLVFLINGLLHEYLATVMIGSITGCQMMFFGLNGLAVAATFRFQPRGLVAILSGILTLAFLFFTSVLFFTAADQFLPWYSHGSVVH
ncbi:MAG: membrane bound O-acyl transferase family-domain-containing protein [Phycisphaerales bacterium]|nr:membrane bound O-acyl transferase family-domain-containing protein [Phycisphaerales bacterium]MCI0631995.1 membrane bound O-acyl transferase family-domain-containing protein [Phycisphaerales bacterium]MCI0676952.1 membrane bound O-acyl transferase family-domain-containing protein [Phycisphaerales bacterium]